MPKMLARDVDFHGTLDKFRFTLSRERSPLSLSISQCGVEAQWTTAEQGGVKKNSINNLMIDKSPTARLERTSASVPSF